jgi:hypothetical protein
MKTLLILGAGTAGTIMASTLRNKLPKGEWTITRQLRRQGWKVVRLWQLCLTLPETEVEGMETKRWSVSARRRGIGRSQRAEAEGKFISSTNARSCPAQSISAPWADISCPA